MHLFPGRSSKKNCLKLIRWPAGKAQRSFQPIRSPPQRGFGFLLWLGCAIMIFVSMLRQVRSALALRTKPKRDASNPRVLTVGIVSNFSPAIYRSLGRRGRKKFGYHPLVRRRRQVCCEYSELQVGFATEATPGKPITVERDWYTV